MVETRRWGKKERNVKLLFSKQTASTWETGKTLQMKDNDATQEAE